MSSVDGYYKCPECGNEQATETYWGHTGEYARRCDKCGWHESHMMDYNSTGRIYTNMMPIDKSVLDVSLPDLSDTAFYSNEDNQIFSEIKKLREECAQKYAFGASGPLSINKLQIALFCAASLIVNPFRKYILDAAEQNSAIKDYAEEYSKRVSAILYRDVCWFAENLELFKTDSDADKKARFEQFIYELYVVETKLFDKYKFGDATAIRNFANDLNYAPIVASDYEWIVYGYETMELTYVHKYVDIANIIKDIKLSQGYTTFAFWYMNDYFSTYCRYMYGTFDYDMYEDMNTAANNVDFASGRYHVADSDKMSLYTTGHVRDIIRKQRNVVCYIHVDSDEDAKDKEAIIDKYLSDNRIRYHETIINKNPINDHYCDEFRQILNDINSGRLSRLIVIDREHFIDSGFEIIDYFCYLNEVELIVVNELDRKSAKDIMSEIAAANSARYASVMATPVSPSGENPFMSFRSMPFGL